MTTFEEFISTFDVENSKGKQFEKFCKWFLENDPVWKSQVKRVWLWDDWPGRWGADLGIDLVFQHANGDIWAVQAKCYKQIYPVTKNDMDSFLSESNRPQIQQRLLMASTDIIGPNARKVCAGQDKKITFQLYSDFLDSKLDFPKDISKLGKAKLLPKPKPRPHQANAIKDVIKGFKKHDRGQMIMACGTGKTFTTLWIKEKLKAESTLILLPSLSLLSQTLKEWYSAANQSFQSLAVCSDETVTRGAEEDATAESTQDLSFPVSSEPKVIAKFLKGSGPKVIFSTYQSSPMIAEAMKGRSVTPFDLVICDEAHRCVGKAGSHFTTILDDKKIKVKQKLFTTATPRTYSSNVKKAAKDNEIIITGMDDEKVFGPEFHKLSFGEAIEQKLLTDYQVVIVGVDEPMIKEWITDRELLEIEEGVSVDAESLAAQIGVLKAIKDYDLKRLITFHGRVKRAENFSKDILSIAPFIPKKDLPKGILKTDYVSGKMPTNKRRQKLEQLKDLYECDRQILSNARCLSEGVDVPALEGIAIIDPRKSQVDIVQTVGRAIRLSGDKKIGTIIIPVFIENSEDPELAIENSNFKPVYDVLNALKSHDENLAFELDEIRTQMGRRKTSTGPSNKIPKVSIDLPKRLSLDFSESIKTVLVENSTASWNYSYGIYKRYINQNNDNYIKQKVITKDGYRLGQWCSEQRALNNKNKLPIERKNKLDQIGFMWDIINENWNQAFKYLEEYKKENNSTLVPRSFKTKDGFSLGEWVSAQRIVVNFKRKIDPEKRDQLYSIGFIDNVDDHLWHENFNAVKEYYVKNKSFKIPKNFKTKEGALLNRWVIRQQKKIQNNTISEEKKALLLSLGLNSHEDRWNRGFNFLKLYVEETNEYTVPKKLIFKNFELGRWWVSQRQMIRKNQIKPERKALILALGLHDDRSTRWEIGFENLKQYCKELKPKQKNFPTIPQAFKFKGFPLGAWVRNQRHNKTISSSNKSRLDDIGFVWENNHNEMLQKEWDIGLNHYINYKKNYLNDAILKFINDEGYPLGQWISTQKKSKSKNKLSADRIDKLEKAGIVWAIKKGTKTKSQ